MRPVLSGLFAGAPVAALSALAVRAPPDRAGWRRIAPGPMHWIGLGLGAGLVPLMVYVRLFVGSKRADAATQMEILTWLIVAFALGTVVLALSIATIRRRAIRWRGARVAWRRGGRERAADLGTVVAIRGNWLGYRVLAFEDGTALWLDPYARGARELLEAAETRLPGGGA